MADGSYPEITRSLGYRFRLTPAELPAQVAADGLLTARLAVVNDGWAAPYNARGQELLLRHTGTGARIVVPTPAGPDADPHRWKSGGTHAVRFS